MKVEICLVGNYTSSVIEKDVTESEYNFLIEVVNELNNSGKIDSPELNIYIIQKN